MKTFIPALTALGLITSPALADSDTFSNYMDGSWISLNGTVTSVEADEFNLDTGSGMLRVEMDDWDHDGDAYAVVDGDRVTVYGRVDKNLLTSHSVEASSVFVHDLNTYFYASAVDEESWGPWIATNVAPIGDYSFVGTVESVSPDDMEFTIDTGDSVVTVDVSGLYYNPLDSEGFQKIEAGDRVSVVGELDVRFFDLNELTADSVVTLSS
jgi:uncharacterized protein YdeI (BOF family)